MSFPLVGNPSDLFGIVKKDSGQARMTENYYCKLLQMFNHCMFITFRKFVTPQAVSPDLLGKA